jgi:ABC-type transport system substrate-binding protein
VQQIERGGAAAEFDLIFGRWNLDREEAALELFRQPAGPGPSVNLFGWSSETTEQTIRDFYAEPSGPRREALMQGLHRHLHEQRPYLFLWDLKTRSIFRKDRISGFKAAPYYFYSRFERIAWKEPATP